MTVKSKLTRKIRKTYLSLHVLDTLDGYPFAAFIAFALTSSCLFLLSRIRPRDGSKGSWRSKWESS
jgi:hypothetical protein